MTASIETFETTRLVAERISPDHLPDLCRLNRDPEVMKTLASTGGILPEAETRFGLQQSIEHWQEHGFGWWVFHRKSDGQFIGRSALKRYEIDGENVVGLGYAVPSDYWNQGFATEMAGACVGVGFERLGLSEIAAWALPHNLASLRVMEKIGFCYERDIMFADLVHRFYRLGAGDWSRSRAESAALRTSFSDAGQQRVEHQEHFSIRQEP